MPKVIKLLWPEFEWLAIFETVKKVGGGVTLFEKKMDRGEQTDLVFGTNSCCCGVNYHI